MNETDPKHPQHGLFVEQTTSHTFDHQPCLFIDRDGVVVEEVNYLHKVDDLQIIPGITDAIARVNAARIPVVLVTNQAGIGRGYYTWSDFKLVQKALTERLRADNAWFDLVLACAYHRDGLPEFAIDAHPWRKPNPGMLQEAQRLLGIDLGNSFMVGDNYTDLQAGYHAKLGRGALVLTGHGEREYRKRRNFDLGSFTWSHYSTACEAIDDWLETLTKAGRAP